MGIVVQLMKYNQLYGLTNNDLRIKHRDIMGYWEQHQPQVGYLLEKVGDVKRKWSERFHGSFVLTRLSCSVMAPRDHRHLIDTTDSPVAAECLYQL
jgi:hypothetical protein